MAAMSSTSSSPFDVFINHRGPDVKKGIASHLYRTLKQHGLRVFLDDGELQRGDRITPQIQGAIRTASVHLAIFSPRYAQSRWCLDELLMMLESRSTIIPVFYDVNPSELRWTRGEEGLCARFMSIVHCILLCTRGEDRGYARDLRMLEKKTTTDSLTNKKKPRYDSNIVEKWRKALSDASHISGFELNACNRDEGHLVDQVVQEVLKKVKKTPLDVAQYPTGLDDKVKEFETIMLSQQQSAKTGVVGIVGLGGVGKSTLAKEFFNRYRSNYDRSCFVYDVRENAAKDSLNLLQVTLLKELAQRDEQIISASQGRDKFKQYLSSSHRALIVLDDVDHTRQLDALFSPVKDAIHSDSLIVVTSRNRDVLMSSDIPESSIYRLTGLNPHHSRKLFCSHAFGPSHSVEGFDEVIDQFLDACQGLPLSLKVLGALLRAGKGDLNHWKAQLRKISKILPDDIQSTLRVSYDSLDEWEKQIFLDIACFFIGEDRDTAIRVWDGSDWEGSLSFPKLEYRCLVDVDSKNRIRMHDHLRDLGRNLAEKEQPGCRFWRPTEHLLYNLSGQSSVRGINMVHLNDPEQSFENSAGRHLLTNMSSLQLLWAKGYFVERLFRAGHLGQLIYLRWDNCPSSTIPFSIPLNNLRVLYIEGNNLKTLWQHESQVPLQLRELRINADHLKIIPDSIGKLKHLEKFVLHGKDLESLADSIGNMRSLQSLDLRGCLALQMLPDSVGLMTSLQSLNLSTCSALRMLPDSVGQMTSLQSLDLSQCSTLQMLPDSVGQMKSLQSLNLSTCSALRMLPNSVGQMTSLQSLDLSRCSTLRMLPYSIGQMTSLQSLDLRRCSTLRMLPDSVGQMTSLQSLHLRRCFALQMLPDSVGQMTSLQSLHLRWCCALRMLPNSVGQMTSLQNLDLRGCYALQMLPDSVGQMTSLQSLYLRGCFALRKLPDSVGQMTSLQSLDLRGCSALQMLPESVEKMRSLQSLDLGGCSALQMLPDSVGQMTSLQSLHLGGCSALQMLPDSVAQMMSLQSLHLGWCSTLQMLPDLVGQMTSLQSLHLGRCSALQMLPNSVGQMTSLQSLDLGGCSALQRLPNSVGQMTSLQSLHLGGCSNLQMLPDSVGQMRSLQSLHLGGCSALQMLPDSVGQMRSLQSLYLGGCSALQMLPDSVGQMRSLQSLDLSGWSSLHMFPDSVVQMTSLQSLDLSGWSALQMLLDSVGQMTNLQSLDLSGCYSLQILPDSIGQMTSLQSLDLTECSALQMLPDSIGQMTSLQSLNLSRCYSLKILPYSVGNMTSLKSLYLYGCIHLEELPAVEHLNLLEQLDVSNCPKLQCALN